MKLDFNLVDFVGYMCGAIPAWRVTDDDNGKAKDNSFDFDGADEVDNWTD